MVAKNQIMISLTQPVRANMEKSDKHSRMDV